MGEDARRRDGVAAEDIEAQRLDGLHLHVGKFRIVKIMARVVNLDADRE